LIIDSGITLGIFPVLELLAPELKVYFTTREGGTSPPPYDSLNLGDGLGDRPGNVRRNRRLLLATLGIDSRRIVRAVQVHGSKIAVVNRGGIYRGVDGLITATRNLTLAEDTRRPTCRAGRRQNRNNQTRSRNPRQTFQDRYGTCPRPDRTRDLQEMLHIPGTQLPASSGSVQERARRKMACGPSLPHRPSTGKGRTQGKPHPRFRYVHLLRT
jgi:hypothetical protein